MTETTFDTDMQIHCQSGDRTLRDEARSWRAQRQPVVLSQFTLVEFKHAVIQPMVLVRNKTALSASLRETAARANHSGGRRAAMMLMRLFDALEAANVPTTPWPAAQAALIVSLDAQIKAAWASVSEGVSRLLDEIECNRADEPPEQAKSGWKATIPRCRTSNTSCKILGLFSRHTTELAALERELGGLPVEQLTRELAKTREVVSTTIAGRFPWEGTTCQSVGDLIIALQAKSTKGLVTSNHKEHSVLTRALGHFVEFFPVSRVRTK